MFSSTAVKSRGKLSVVSPRSERYVGGGGARRGCGLRPPRNLRAQRAPDGISISSSTEENIVIAVILSQRGFFLYRLRPPEK